MKGRSKKPEEDRRQKTAVRREEPEYGSKKGKRQRAKGKIEELSS